MTGIGLPFDGRPIADATSPAAGKEAGDGGLVVDIGGVNVRVGAAARVKRYRRPSSGRPKCGFGDAEFVTGADNSPQRVYRGGRRVVVNAIGEWIE
jgi:hypothetical protein